MANKAIILVDPQDPGDIDWEKVGTVVTELSELYQLVKESVFDLLLYDDNRRDISHAVALRLYRYNPLMDIWSVVEDEFAVSEADGFVDGQFARTLGEDGVIKRVGRILADKELLNRYGIVGRSRKMRAVARTIERIAATEVSVLVVGPSGVGKEVVAHALHRDSNRKDKPFVAINCGALAEGILESELFGHEKGAFTGSVGRREGLFHKADGGTVFLDEIGETKPEMQVKLLRVLEDGTYYPVGSSTPNRANVRVIAATNRDLTEAIADRQFRDDLYFRISVVKLILPSLMDRRHDIQPLLRHFLKDYPDLSYTDSALALLMKYDWPGNVRQLKNFAMRMTAFKQTGLVDDIDVQRFLAEQHVSATHLPVSTGKTVEEAGHELIYRAILQLGTEVRMLRDLITSQLPSEPVSSEYDESEDVDDEVRPMEEVERQMIERALKETAGNRKVAARLLGIGERTLYRKLTKHGLS